MSNKKVSLQKRMILRGLHLPVGPADQPPDPIPPGPGSPRSLQRVTLKKRMILRGLRLAAGQSADPFSGVVTPVTRSLVATRFAPVIKLTVVPGKKALTLATFAPVIKLVILPGKKTLTLTRFAPQLRLVVTPPKKALTLTRFAPVVSVKIIPGTATLSLTSSAPILNLKVLPPTKALTVTRFAPIVTKGGGLVLVPDTRTFTLVTFAPSALVPRRVVPATLALTLTRPRAKVILGIHSHPGTAALHTMLFTAFPHVTVSMPVMIRQPEFPLLSAKGTIQAKLAERKFGQPKPDAVMTATVRDNS